MRTGQAGEHKGNREQLSDDRGDYQHSCPEPPALATFHPYPSEAVLSAGPEWREAECIELMQDGWINNLICHLNHRFLCRPAGGAAFIMPTSRFCVPRGFRPIRGAMAAAMQSGEQSAYHHRPSRRASPHRTRSKAA